MSNELPKTYDPSAVEDKLYQFWNDSGFFNAEVDENKKPFTIVIPPPNVTGQLHMGHAFDETLQDILIRTKRMQGYSALLDARHRPCRHCNPNQGRGKPSCQ